MASNRMLEGCRALDLTNERGFFCGKMLADLGVDVIKIERPGGDPSRRLGPFWHDIPDPDKSLYWFAYNAGKRGITLDIENDEGKQIFIELVKSADFVIESFDPGYMEKLGLGYSALCKIKNSIILTSITPFGQSGPYSAYQASDIVVMGMAGQLFLTGDADRPPVNISMPQSYLQAGSDAAVGSMVAYRHMRKTGEGQHVDISMQQSAAWFLATTIPYWELSGVTMSRVGTFRSGGSSGAAQRQVWPCRDGFVFFFMIGGMQGAKTCRQLVKWMVDEGVQDEFLTCFEWEKFDMATATQDLIDRISRPIADFFLIKTKKEALEAAITRSISICPLFSMEDVLSDPNLAARGFWEYIEHPELNASIPYPKQYVRSSENEMGSSVRAPVVGQDNAEVYGAIGLSDGRLNALKESGVL